MKILCNFAYINNLVIHTLKFYNYEFSNADCKSKKG